MSRTLVAACLVLGVGCAGDGPPPLDAGSDFEAIQRDIFNVNCVAGPCHNSAARANDLVLEEGQSHASLVGVLPTNPTARAGGFERVAPGNPEQSFLLIKLTDPGVGEGSPMPLGAPPLSPGDIERIRAWIASGAPGSSTPMATPTPTPSPSLQGYGRSLFRWQSTCGIS